MKKNKELIILICFMAVALALFLYLYRGDQIPIEKPLSSEAPSSLEEWTVEKSAANGQPLNDDKSIYEHDNSIYDVYISVFPTKDENGKMLDFSAFNLHKATDHSYNPVLNCNVQILPEDGKLDPLADLENTNATIRVRGNSARGKEFKSYKIKLKDEKDGFYGQTSLNINKHCSDRTKVTTKFCTDILQSIPDVPSLRTNFMRLWIRDASLPESQQEFTYYGLFTQTEQPNKKFLEARSLSPNCVMYKARNFYFQKNDFILDVDDPNYNEEIFEEYLGIREGTNHKKLMELLDVVNDETLDIMEVMENYFNEENYLNWLSFNLLVGGADILNHNFLLYSPNNSKTWYFLTWDYDSNMSVRDSTVIPVSHLGGQKLNQVSFHRRYFRYPGNLEKIQKRMEEMMQDQFSSENISAMTAGYLPVLEKTMYLQPDLDLLFCTPDELLQNIETYPQIIQRNYNNFITAFQFPAPMFVAAPERNGDNSLHLAWNPSYSYQGRTITYKVQIANDCHMQDILFEKDNIISTNLDAEINLDPGTYYLKVRAIDSEGNEQVSLEHYEFAGDRFIYESGVLEFKLN